MGIFKGDGTRLSKTAVQGLVTAVNDPQVRLNEAVYEDFDYQAGEKDTDGKLTGLGRRLKWPVGKVVRQSELDALFPAATISAVTPSGGPLAGGTAITITGTGFSAGSTVTVGGAAATNVNVVSTTEVRCTTPAGTTGARDVVVTTDAGAVTRAGAFTYA